MANLILILELILAVAVVGALARRVSVPAPILYVAAGLALSFAPPFAAARLDPEIFFALFIPPLLFADGWKIPKRELFAHLRPILLLALGLVTLTVLVVGYVIHWMIPSLPLAAAFALGAVISPTDAVAVAAITERLSLPRRVVSIINGESLINDASGLVAFKFAVAAAATGVFSTSAALGSFLVLSAGGILIGIVVAWLTGQVRSWLHEQDLSAPTIQAVFSILTPFAAYFAAEHFAVSGILAVVASGIYAGMDDSRHLTRENRLHTWEVWSLLLFVLNGLVFLLLGLQLHSVAAGAAGHTAGELFGYALALLGLVTVTRMAWMYPGAYIPRLLSRRIREREVAPPFAALAVISWSGIRGAVTLAAALSIPLEVAPGVPFPERNLIILLATSVILGTLLLNGLTLPALIRAVGLKGGDEEHRETLQARESAARAAIAALAPYLDPALPEEEKMAAQVLIGEYEDRLDHLLADGEARHLSERNRQLEKRLRCVALSAERDALFALRDAREINDEVLRIVQRELDYWESAHFSSGESAAR